MPTIQGIEVSMTAVYDSRYSGIKYLMAVSPTPNLWHSTTTQLHGGAHQFNT